MEERDMLLRLILAIVLSVMVLVTFEHLFLRQKAQRPPEGPEKVQRAQQEIQPLKERKAPFPLEGYSDIVVETPLYRAVFTTYGGRLKSITLKGYRDKVELHPLGRWVQGLIARIFGKRLDTSPPKPVELVSTSQLERLPLGLVLSGIDYDESVPWVASSTNLRVSGKPEELRMVWGKGDVVLQRVYRFFPESYQIEVSVEANREVFLGLGWIGRTDLKKSYYGFYGPIFLGPQGRTKLKPKKIKKGEIRHFEQIRWFAFDQDYFASIIAPKSPGRLMLGRLDKKTVYGFITSDGPSRSHYFRLFLGPKDPDKLEQFLPTAEKVIDYGTFGIIAIPILKIMRFTHGFTGNWGFDIILLALFIKLVFFWPTQKSYEAMKEMQKLAPEIKMLQKKYKDDKQRLQKELMELYRRRKVNPFSGCLPLLLQLPVFFALYRALLVSIDLRHAPFILWIRDLSGKDPTYISPLLMGATMFLQQKLTPSQGDPQQQKMMLFLPLIFTVLFLNFPSGLVIYWLASNVFGILHQLYLSRRR